MPDIPIIEYKGGTLPIDPNDRSLNDPVAIYLVDTPGMEKGKPSVDVIESLSMKGRRHLWIDSGPRDTEDIIDVLVTGSGTVVIRHGSRFWKDLAIEALGLTESVAVWFHSMDEPGAYQEIKWLIGKGIETFVIWSGSPGELPDGARFLFRRSGSMPGLENAVDRVLMEAGQDAGADGDS